MLRHRFWAALVGIFAITGCSVTGTAQIAPSPPVNIVTTPSRIAITIDDLPFVRPSKTTPEEGLRYTQQINAALRQHGIIATGFAVGQQINARSLPALQAFADAGHTIGNHSWSHPDYGTLTRDEFHEETRKTHEILQRWMTGPRYYRFPFLREGKTEPTKAAATQVLTEFGYQNVPVTIDNDEWQYNADYVAALDKGDATAAATIASNYITHMQERTAFFQNLAMDELGADPDHILLIHLNRINADHLGTLLAWYDAQGWTLIPVDTALAHPVFSRPDIYAGPRGLSQIERVLGGKRDQPKTRQ